MAEAIAALPTLRLSPAETPRSQEAKEPDQPDEGSAESAQAERGLLERAAQGMGQIEWLSREQWKQLDIHEKKAALNAAGRILGELYEVPNPPLLVTRMEDAAAYGSYGDGYRLNTETGDIEGADYAIKMNLAGGVNYEKLFGDDPAIALETYAHEFRHSYQAQQIQYDEKPQHRHLVTDTAAVERWRAPYITPDEDYEAYRNQPVEQDAREFAETLVAMLYDH